MIPPTGRFPREARIRRSSEFRTLSEEGRRYSSGAFVLLVGRGWTGTSRLGVTASRRVGNAVVRNRVKRRIREWFRREGRLLITGSDLVVIARPAAAALGGEATSAELSRGARAIR